MNGFRHTTRLIVPLRAELIGGGHNTTEELSAFISLPSVSPNSRKLCACPRRMAVLPFFENKHSALLAIKLPDSDSHVSSCLARRDGGLG